MFLKLAEYVSSHSHVVCESECLGRKENLLKKRRTANIVRSLGRV